MEKHQSHIVLRFHSDELYFNFRWESENGRIFTKYNYRILLEIGNTEKMQLGRVKLGQLL